MAAEQLRVGIAGTGFIGAVHARCARLAGARVVSRRGVVAGERREGRDGAAGGAGRASAEELVAGPGARRRAHLHPQPPPRAARHGCAGGRQARGLREAARHGRRRGRGAGRRRGAPTGPHAAVPFVYRFYPTVREARERVRGGETGAVHLVHGTLSPGLAPATRGRELAGGRGPRRRVARLRRHRLALVRPRGVRDRPPARPALGADDHRGSRAPRRLRPACLRGRRRGRRRLRG